MVMCNSRKYPYPLQGRLTEFPRERGVSKAHFLKEKYGTNSDGNRDLKTVKLQYKNQIKPNMMLISIMITTLGYTQVLSNDL